MIFRFKSPFLAVHAALLAAWWKLRGYRVLATDSEYGERITTCYACKHFVRSSEQCGICTCLVHAKTLLTSEVCPKGFWLRIKDKAVTV